MDGALIKHSNFIALSILILARVNGRNGGHGQQRIQPMAGHQCTADAPSIVYL